ncbi:MAG: cysteine desulfurase [Acidimicrobiia bacterium]|nr:cysteine desulfurase [Acidimicrobiia bacterium]
MARHYLDHASTSPLRPQATEAMLAALGQPWGDPSRIHHEAMAARVALENARDGVATLVGARNREVVFTSGATEAISAAVWGAAERGDHLVVSAVEHSAVRLAADRLAEAGSHTVDVVGVDRTGRVDPDEVADRLRDTTALVAVQSVNHEVGTCQPVDEVVTLCRERGLLSLVDAAQSVGRADIDFSSSGIDLLAVSAHKLGGPPGIGALCIRRGLRLPPLLVGGEQERARRAGMENLPAAIGFGAAATALAGEDVRTAEAAEQRRLSHRLAEGMAALDGVTVYGDPQRRAPHIVCCGIDGIEPQAVLLGLDQAGVAAHAGSACASADLQPSPVLAAMGVDAHRSLRLSVGWSSTDADIDAALDALPPLLGRLRALGGSAN